MGNVPLPPVHPRIYSHVAAHIVMITCHMSNSARFNKPIVRSYTVLFWRSSFNFKANALLGWIAKFQISCNNFCEWPYTKTSAVEQHAVSPHSLLLIYRYYFMKSQGVKIEMILPHDICMHFKQHACSLLCGPSWLTFI